MPVDAFIQCRVTPEMKTLVRALAEREPITELALVKQLVARTGIKIDAAGPAKADLSVDRVLGRDSDLYCLHFGMFRSAGPAHTTRFPCDGAGRLLEISRLQSGSFKVDPGRRCEPPRFGRYTAGHCAFGH